MLRDPARTKTKVGHRPGKIPVEGPFEVRAATGTSVDLADVATGAKRSGVHAENLVYLRYDVADYEKARVRRSADSIIPVAEAPRGESERKSFGQLMENRAVSLP